MRLGMFRWANRQNDPIWIPGARTGGADVAAESAIARARGQTKFTVVANTAAGGVEAVFPLERNLSRCLPGLGRARTDAAAAFAEAGAVCSASDVLGIHGVGKSEDAFGFADCNDHQSVPGRR